MRADLRPIGTKVLFEYRPLPRRQHPFQDSQVSGSPEDVWAHMFYQSHTAQTNRTRIMQAVADTHQRVMVYGNP